MLSSNLRAVKGIKLLLFGMPNRYGNLTRTVRNSRCRRILEIGVWNGRTARAMISSALRSYKPDQISYWGIDLFDDATPTRLDYEVGKSPPAMEEVERSLRDLASLGVKITLLRGPSSSILPELADAIDPPDLVFIDGGHSFETVSEDWYHVQRMMGLGTVVIFDDYVNSEGELKDGYGVNRVIDAIDRKRYSVHFLRPIDSYPRLWGRLRTRMVRVQRRASLPG